MRRSTLRRGGLLGAAAIASTLLLGLNQPSGTAAVAKPEPTAQEAALRAAVTMRERLGFPIEPVGEATEGRVGAAVTKDEANLFDLRFGEWVAIQKSLASTIESNDTELTSIGWYANVVNPVMVVRGLKTGETLAAGLAARLPKSWSMGWETSTVSRFTVKQLGASLKDEWVRAFPQRLASAAHGSPDGVVDVKAARQTGVLARLTEIGVKVRDINIDPGPPTLTVFVDPSTDTTRFDLIARTTATELQIDPNTIEVSTAVPSPTSRDVHYDYDEAGKQIVGPLGRCSSGPIVRVDTRPGSPNPPWWLKGDYMATAGHCFNATSNYQYADGFGIGYSDTSLRCQSTNIGGTCGDYGGVDIGLIKISNPAPMVENCWSTGTTSTDCGQGFVTGQVFQFTSGMLCWEGASRLRDGHFVDSYGYHITMATSCGLFTGNTIGDQVQEVTVYPGSATCHGDSGSIVRYPDGGGSTLVGVLSSGTAIEDPTECAFYGHGTQGATNARMYYSNYGTWRHWLYWWRDVDVQPRMDWNFCC